MMMITDVVLKHCFSSSLAVVESFGGLFCRRGIFQEEGIFPGAGEGSWVIFHERMSQDSKGMVRMHIQD